MQFQMKFILFNNLTQIKVGIFQVRHICLNLFCYLKG